MTDKLIERIEAGRKAGVEWYSVQPDYANGWYVVASDPDGNCTLDESGDGGFDKETADRIATLPDLEARILSDAKIIKAAKELAYEVYLMTETEDGSVAMDMDEALAAYRKAVSEAGE